ncbi:MAG TPA: type IV secretory system conjugative DNA transfer family protein, partial [Sphingomonas sp.]
NYAGHRLAPWLAHVMVSRQETARALLTPGEVMQLPATDELVLISGLAPIIATKLRYYEDRNFVARLAPPPVLGDGPYADRPAAHDCDWPNQARGVDARLSGSDADGRENAEGGLEQQRHPGLPEDVPSHALVQELLPLDIEEDDTAADQRAMELARSATTRGYGLNQADHHDLFPGI